MRLEEGKVCNGSHQRYEYQQTAPSRYQENKIKVPPSQLPQLNEESLDTIHD